MNKITVIKRNIKEIETWRYEAKELLRKDNLIMLEALYNRDDSTFLGIELKRNDRFIETFFIDRWFNIFEIHDRDDDSLKGWYCDICKPAIISTYRISYIDLSLDLWIFPDGRSQILDEDEFNRLEMDEKTRKQALESLVFLKENFFEIIDSLPKVQA